MSIIIDKISPITGGKVELCKKTAEITYRGELITYEQSYYRCVDSGFEFADEELEKNNLQLIYDTYRYNHSIPTIDELKTMRKRYGIPSSAMSLILGLGENQYGLYEEGTMPTVSVGRLLSLAMNPDNMINMLLSCGNIFQERQLKKYYDSIKASLHPSKYDIEYTSIMDYDSISIPHMMPVTKRISSKKNSTKKYSYKDYIYADAC